MAMATDLTENTLKFYLRDIYALIGSRGRSALESFMKKEELL
jgi:DNA-binding CsgD family transcriptional regulator